MTTTTLYISAFLIAYVLTLGVVGWVFIANKRYDRDTTRKVKDIDQAIKDAGKALEKAEDLEKAQDRYNEKMIGFEELLTSFTNRMSARTSSDKKKLSNEEILAQAFTQQASQLNGNHQQELEIEEMNPKKKPSLIRRK